MVPDTREFLVIEQGKLVKKAEEIPVLGEYEVLVEVKAVAVNPTDWKTVDGGFGEGAAAGNDFSGIIAKAGNGVTVVTTGDKVNGAVNGGDALKKGPGAFANYLVTHERLVHKFSNLERSLQDSIPESIAASTFEGAASIPLCLWTIVLGISSYTKIPLVKDSKKGQGYALVYGAGSSLGWYAIQILHYLGYEVIGVGSERNAHHLRSIGLTHLVDYHDPNWVDAVRKIAGDEVVYALDTIGACSSTQKTEDVTSNTSEVGILAAMLPPFDHGQAANVEVHLAMSYFIFTNKNIQARRTWAHHLVCRTLGYKLSTVRPNYLMKALFSINPSKL